MNKGDTITTEIVIEKTKNGRVTVIKTLGGRYVLEIEKGSN